MLGQWTPCFKQPWLMDRDEGEGVVWEYGERLKVVVLQFPP